MTDLAPLAATLLGLLLGAVIGSFLAAIVVRWPQGRSVLRGRSQCDHCGRTLAAVDLVPLVSHIIARGRCRYCGAPIDTRHFAIEATTALIGVLAFSVYPFPVAPVTFLFGCWLLLLAILDLEHQWLPDRLTLPLIPAGLAVGWIGIGPALGDRAIGAVAGFAVLAGIALAYRRLRGREGLGGGDPKLLAAIGAWLGWRQLPLVLLGAGLVGLAVILLMRARGKSVAATDRLPLGTLMALVAWPIWLMVAS